MNWDDFDSQTLGRIAAALEGISEGQAALSKQLECYLKLREEEAPLSFEDRTENVSLGLRILNRLSEEKATIIRENFGKPFAEKLGYIIAALPNLLNITLESRRLNRLMMAERENAVSEKFDQEIINYIAPCFVYIRDFMMLASNYKNYDVVKIYEESREAAIEIVSKNGPWQREQMGTINLIRCLFDKDTYVDNTSSSTSVEKLLIVLAAIAFLQTLLANVKKIETETPESV